MRTAKWQNILYIFLLLAAIFLLFQWYSATNSRQIEERNLNYAMDSARQAALRLDSELLNGLRRVRNYAYLLSTTMQEPDVGTDLLRQLEDNSDFDALCFTSSEGINLSSDGRINNSLDRIYFTEGMQGESGATVVFESRITGETMIVFYLSLIHI